MTDENDDELDALLDRLAALESRVNGDRGRNALLRRHARGVGRAARRVTRAAGPGRGAATLRVRTQRSSGHRGRRLFGTNRAFT